MSDVRLTNECISVRLDPGRGADILELTHQKTGVNVLFSTPWRDRADQIRAGKTRPAGVDSTSIWMEQYRGGWQIICPNPGAPRTIGGGVVGFHGETSTASWRVIATTPDTATLEVELFSIPLRIMRNIVLDAAKITISDEVHNLSDQILSLDYCSHPAFGGTFLDGDVRLSTGATRFNPDPDTYGDSAESWISWPTGRLGAESSADLSVLSQNANNPLVFGWLSDFDDYWVQLSNHDLGIAAKVTWDDRNLPYAWVWEELNSTLEFPWFGRARAIAIEPSSTPTSGIKRIPGIVLAGQETRSFSTSIEIVNVGGER